MYASFFGLTEAPFSISPDPRYLYMSNLHREALAHLIYGVKEGGGFVQLTGEVGTGKTTLCRCLLEQLADDIDVALILNPRFDHDELFTAICDELRVDYPDGATARQLLGLLNDYLLAAFAKGRRTILIIDEAQSLSNDLLEQVRLLTNLETTKEKLLQIILIGQPELNTRLQRPDLRQLAQRITARFHLDPLAPADTAEYVKYRLSVAGCQQSLFSRRALGLLYRYSGGVPRLLNLICDRALLGAYSQNRRSVTGTLVREAAAEVLGRSKPRRRPVLAWSLAVLAVIALLALPGIRGPIVDLYLQHKDLGDDIAGVAPVLDRAISSQDGGLQQKGLGDDIAGAAPVLDRAVPSQDGGLQQKGLGDDIAGAAPVLDRAISSEDGGLQQKGLGDDIAGAAPVLDRAVPSEDEVALDASLAGHLQPEGTAPPAAVSTHEGVRHRKAEANNIIALSEALRRHQAGTNYRAAFQRLLSLWGIEQNSAAWGDCDVIRQLGLNCLKYRGTWNNLRSHNRMAILALRHDGTQYHVLVTALEDQTATLDLGDKSLKFPIKEIDELWFGEYTLLWRPPPLNSRIIAANSRGPDVVWLREALNRVTDPPAAKLDVSNPEFDEELRQRIISFQRSHSLEADGIVGVETLIRLNTVLADRYAPLLTPSPRS